jgi:hypothetical protein
MDHDWITTLLATGHATTDASPLLGTPTITHVGRSYKAVNGFWYQVTWDAGIPVVNPMGYSSAYLDATRASPPRPRPGHAQATSTTPLLPPVSGCPGRTRTTTRRAGWTRTGQRRTCLDPQCT